MRCRLDIYRYMAANNVANCTKVSDKKVQISSWPVQAFVQRQMKGRSCMCMALSCKKTMADPHDSNRERRGWVKRAQAKGYCCIMQKNGGKLI